jgi:hypothetical protein
MRLADHVRSGHLRDPFRKARVRQRSCTRSLTRAVAGLGDAIDMYLDREQAEADLERVLRDEPEWESFLSVEPVELLAADFPN